MRITRAASILAGVALALGAVALPAQAAQAAQAPPPGAGPMIIGGGDATETHGSVRLYVEGNEACSSTIIDPEWVLTARHCVEDVDEDDADEVSFKIGNVEAAKGEEVHAKEEGIHVHDNADLALVNLERPVETGYAQLGKQPFIGGLTQRAADIYGWGATCRHLPSFLCQSPVLKKASVVITDTDPHKCRTTYGGRGLCVSRGDGHSAQGDSGGPLFVTGMNGKPYQVGVASGVDHFQTMYYANLLEYQDWIEDVIDD